MGRVSRRGAIKTLGAAAAALHLPAEREALRRTRRSLGGGGQAADLDPPVLAALAEVVLPAEADRQAAVAAFVRWIQNYKEGADTDHGYGNTRIRATGPSPARSYAAQLAALDAAARASGAPGFASAPLEVRRGIVEAAIAEARIERLPPRPTGGHIATDLMGHYFGSSAASDLCYRAAIGRDECRGLPGSEKAPAPLVPRAPR